MAIGSWLTLIFVVCKLWDKITWSWWWVLSPLWIEFLAWIVFIIIWGLAVGESKRG